LIQQSLEAAGTRVVKGAKTVKSLAGSAAGLPPGVT